MGESEFIAAWTDLTEVLLEESARVLGLSTLYIVIYVLLAIGLVTTLFVFIFFAMGGWYQGKLHRESNQSRC